MHRKCVLPTRTVENNFGCTNNNTSEINDRGHEDILNLLVILQVTRNNTTDDRQP